MLRVFLIGLLGLGIVCLRGDISDDVIRIVIGCKVQIKDFYISPILFISHSHIF